MGRLAPLCKYCFAPFRPVRQCAGIRLVLVTMTVETRVFDSLGNLPDIVSLYYGSRIGLVIMSGGQGAEPAGVVIETVPLARLQWYYPLLLC